MRLILLLILMLQSISLFAIEIPKESAYALGATRGKPISTGLVFVNGKYLPGPYVIERWGVGIRINRQAAVSQVVGWSAFVKTQKGVRKTTKTVEIASTPESAPPPAAVPPQSQEEEEEKDEELLASLESLFEDEPKVKKKPKVSAPKKVVKPVAQPAPPKVLVSYEMSEKFEHNDATRRMVGKINDVRREIDQHLRNGGFLFFGENYSRVSGDMRSLEMMLSKLPEAMRSCSSAKDLTSRMHECGMVYFSDALCADLYRNRIDYRSLIELRERMKNEAELRKILNNR